MKRVLSILSALLLILSFSGCGYSEKDLSAAKDAAYSAGYSEAEAAHKLDYENGYSAAEDEHKNDYDNGYQDGYNAAEKELYESRYDDGYSDDYGEGYQDGAASAVQSSYTYQFTPSTSSISLIACVFALESKLDGSITICITFILNSSSSFLFATVDGIVSGKPLSKL